MLTQTIIFICEILQKVIAIGIPYGLVYIIWMPNRKLYVFYFYSMLHLCLKIFLSKVSMNIFLETYFKLSNWRFLEIIYVDVTYIKMVLLVSYQSFQFF
jgi:hypothetical protein